MFDHVTIRVADPPSSTEFYEMLVAASYRSDGEPGLRTPMGTTSRRSFTGDS